MNKRGIGFVELAIVECVIATAVFIGMPMLRANQQNITPDDCVDCPKSGGRATQHTPGMQNPFK